MEIRGKEEKRKEHKTREIKINKPQKKKKRKKPLEKKMKGRGHSHIHSRHSGPNQSTERGSHSSAIALQRAGNTHALMACSPGSTPRIHALFSSSVEPTLL